MDEPYTQLVALACMPLVLMLLSVLIDVVGRKFSSNQDVYILKNKRGYKVKIVIDKTATPEERTRIFNAKIRELAQISQPKGRSRAQM